MRERLDGCLGVRGFAARLCVAQGFVDDHFKIGLVAQAALGRLDAGFGDVFGVEANCGGGDGLRFRETESPSQQIAVSLRRGQAGPPSLPF